MLYVSDACLEFGEGGIILGRVSWVIANEVNLRVIGVQVEIGLV